MTRPPRFRIRKDVCHIGRSISRCYELYECDERGSSRRRVVATPRIFGEGAKQNALLAQAKTDIEVILGALVRLGQ